MLIESFDSNCESSLKILFLLGVLIKSREEELRSIRDQLELVILYL